MNKPAFVKWAMESISHKVKGFDRIESSEKNIKKYTKLFPGLCHIEVGKDFQGILLISKKDEFVGILQCNIKTGYIVSLEIGDNFRRQGLAQTLLKIAQDEFNCKKLTVRKNNWVAIKLYKKVGYKIFKEEGAIFYMEKK